MNQMAQDDNFKLFSDIWCPINRYPFFGTSPELDQYPPIVDAPFCVTKGAAAATASNDLGGVPDAETVQSCTNRTEVITVSFRAAS